jgi:hypothetical protein
MELLGAGRAACGNPERPVGGDECIVAARLKEQNDS